MREREIGVRGREGYGEGERGRGGGTERKRGVWRERGGGNDRERERVHYIIDQLRPVQQSPRDIETGQCLRQNLI